MRKSRIEQIIEDATTDCYSEDDELSGWFCILEGKLRVPQECRIGKIQGVLVKLLQTDCCSAIYSKVRFEKQKNYIAVPIEYVVLQDKKQDVFIQAYKHWLLQ